MSDPITHIIIQKGEKQHECDVQAKLQQQHIFDISSADGISKLYTFLINTKIDEQGKQVTQGQPLATWLLDDNERREKLNKAGTKEREHLFPHVFEAIGDNLELVASQGKFLKNPANIDQLTGEMYNKHNSANDKQGFLANLRSASPEIHDKVTAKVAILKAAEEELEKYAEKQEPTETQQKTSAIRKSMGTIRRTLSDSAVTLSNKATEKLTGTVKALSEKAGRKGSVFELFKSSSEPSSPSSLSRQSSTESLKENLHASETPNVKAHNEKDHEIPGT